MAGVISLAARRRIGNRTADFVEIDDQTSNGYERPKSENHPKLE
jgi:hypothetical protein